MRQITLVIHQEDGTWWAESPELPGFSSLAHSLDELRSEAQQGVAFHLDDSGFVLVEKLHASSQPQAPWWVTTISDGFASAVGRARGAMVVRSATPEPVTL